MASEMSDIACRKAARITTRSVESLRGVSTHGFRHLRITCITVAGGRTHIGTTTHSGKTSALADPEASQDHLAYASYL
jgi:hypothetical protein